MRRIWSIGGLAALVVLGLCWWSLRPVPGEIRMAAMPTTTQLDALLRKTFPDAPYDALAETHKNVDVEHGFTHVRMRYRSAGPSLAVVVPASVVNDRYAFNTLHRLAVVLPAAADATVMLPVLDSQGWSGGTRQAVVWLYGPRNSMPQFVDVSAEDSGVLSGLRQILVPESWTIASVNFLYGYKAMGVSLALLIGIAMVLVAAWLSRRTTMLVAACTAALAGIAVYDARFAIDLVRGTATDIAAWHTGKTLGEYGDLLHIGEDLTNGKYGSIATCGNADAPIRYAIFPQPLVAPGSADVIVLPTAWTMQGGVLCGDTTLAAEITKTYPEGGGLATPVPPPAR